MPYGYNKPNGVILMYPFITGMLNNSRIVSIQNLLGKLKPTEEEISEFSLENKVDERSAPDFIVHI